MTFPQQDRGSGRQPIFNLPPVIIILLLLLAAIHLVRTTLLSIPDDNWVILNFAFFPSAPDVSAGLGERLPGAAIWSFVTYALLHANWTHLAVNGIWMAAFGSPLAWRFGTWRFLAFSAVAAAAGALVHWLAHGGEQIALIGASAAISAHMAGVVRFLFISRPGTPRSYWSPAASLVEVFSDPRTLIFLGVWFGINIVVGMFGGAAVGGAIAWEAHVGGFLAGLLLFSFFDPVKRRPSDDGPWEADAA
jgi:membrane associated rhomboid family serine protease